VAGDGSRILLWLEPLARSKLVSGRRSGVNLQGRQRGHRDDSSPATSPGDASTDHPDFQAGLDRRCPLIIRQVSVNGSDAQAACVALLCSIAVCMSGVDSAQTKARSGSGTPMALEQARYGSASPERTVAWVRMTNSNGLQRVLTPGEHFPSRRLSRLRRS
jgi:hypothetical protein